MIIFIRTAYGGILTLLKQRFSLTFLKNHFMGSLLYLIAVLLIIGWLLGLFVFHVGGLIHVLLVIAIIVVLIRVIQGRRIG